MSVSSAITINQTQQEIAARLPQGDPPLSDDDAQVSFAPAPGDRGTEVRVVLPDAPEGLQDANAQSLLPRREGRPFDSKRSTIISSPARSGAPAPARPSCSSARR